jgi:phosphoglycerol transferase MdoB-like AlkP superfamily enzyme
MHVYAIIALGVLGVGSYFYAYEGSWPNQLFVNCVTLMIAAGLVFLTGRLLVAAIVVPALIAIVVQASAFKREAMDMIVHAYDIFFYLMSWSTVVYLWEHFRAPLLQLILALTAFVAAIVMAYRLDPTRVSRRYALLVFAICAFLTPYAADIKGERRHTQYYWSDLVVSSFYSSWAETAETLWRGTLIEAAPSGGGGGTAHASATLPFTIPTDCPAVDKPPHVVLIHQESLVQPSIVPGLQYDKRLDRLFESGDGKLHAMRVETYGGASWLTEFSILAGVSTYSFGGMRPFVQALMAGKVKDTLPQAFSRCGYRNVVFYPMLKNFVSNGRFYNAVGLPEIFDMKDQGTTSAVQRDRYYYANMMKLMQTHFGASDKPLFTFLITSSAHQPYTHVFEPQVDVPGGGPGTHPEMHEFLRREAIAQIDYEWLKDELKRRFPNERFLIMQYGDHHPIATRSYFGQGNARAAEDTTFDKDSPAFTTYYTTEGINYQPPPLPDHAMLDVPYLGGLLLEQARLPLSDSYEERKRLRAACDGRYYGCKQPGAILSFHRRLIDSGLIVAR